MWPNPQFPADFVTFTKKSLMENFVFWAVIPYFSDSAKLSNSYRFHHGSRNMIVNLSKGNVFFSNKVAKNVHIRLFLSF